MHRDQELFAICHRYCMAHMCIDCACQSLTLTCFMQAIGVSLKRCCIHPCLVCKILSFLPPETMPVFDVTGYQKDSHGKVQLLCEREAIRVVIIVSVVEGQHERCTSISLLLFSFIRRVEFFQCLL